MPVRWTRRLIAGESFEAAQVCDVDGDGVPDIVSGGFWYQGPDFVRRHPVAMPAAHGEYWDDFSAIPLDIDGDGRVDIVTGGWWGRTLRWRQNPGTPGEPWREHAIAEVGSIETTRAWDLDGDGVAEIVPNTPGDPLCFFRLERDAAGRGTGRFARHLVHDAKHGHGLGFGDIDGDGVGELVTRHGWHKHRGDPLAGPWDFHPDFDLGSASIPIIVTDLNGDGLGDLIVGQAHGYGLHWWEQRRDGGQRRWIRHDIDPGNSQYHDMQWVDIDGDGQPELVTGKRWRAHNHGDPGAGDDVGIYYFDWTGETFAKQVISYGPPGVSTGCGIQFATADLRGTGRLDLVAPGKSGLWVFFNEGMG